MKRCHDCGRLSPEGALFCGACRSSFGVKLCPKLHINPVEVKYCFVCGSEELSKPHRRPRGNRLVVFFWLVVLTLVLVAIAQLIASSIVDHQAKLESRCFPGETMVLGKQNG